MSNYTTQMDAARKGIVTPEIEKVAKKEKMDVDKLMELVASGKVAIPANKHHKSLDAEGVGSMLRTKINVNLGVSRDCKDYDVEMQKVMSAVKLGLAAALACCGFTFLLGGGPIEMLFAFIAAGTGNLIRTKLIKHHFTLFMNIAVSISASCLIYAILLKLAILMFNIPFVHEAGYICSMLFIIPGFPFITSGIDLAKLDLRSGIERLTYSIIIVLVATVFAWIMALLLHLQPEEFTTLHIGKMLHLILRLVASFCGVFGFSIMFNSSVPMAAMASLIGGIANTLRLELVDFTGMPAAAAAFIGAATAGLLASFIKNYNGYPRISLTVPSIVIMVPGLYLYRAIYNFGIMSLTEAVSWFTSAILIIVALPLGLIFARIITDRTFRYCT